MHEAIRRAAQATHGDDRRGIQGMLFTTRLARVGGPIGLAAALSMGAAGVALAQQPQRPAQRAPAQTAPAQAAPAQPAQQPAPAAGAQQGGDTGPMIVQVKSEPSQADWTKVCGKDQASNSEVCYTTRDFVSDQGQPVLAVAVYDAKGGPQGPSKILRFLTPLGLLLQPGVRFAVDQQQATPGRYAICFPNGCFAEAQVKDDVINGLKKGTTLNVSVQNQVSREVTFAVPLAGFGKAFDGPPIDPEVLKKQQEDLQKELERRSDEMRKKLESGASTGGGAPTASAPAPAPASK
jgi:invasion protein IalB